VPISGKWNTLQKTMHDFIACWGIAFRSCSQTYPTIFVIVY
jgi:hypothetical protein